MFGRSKPPPPVIIGRLVIDMDAAAIILEEMGQGGIMTMAMKKLHGREVTMEFTMDMVNELLAKTGYQPSE